MLKEFSMDYDADNVDEFENEDVLTQETQQPDPQSEQDITQTQAFSKRLSEATKKVRAEAVAETRQSIAESFGYDSWDEYLKAQQSSAISNKGYEPDEVLPLIKEAMKSDPEYIEAMKYKAEKEELEKTLWAKNSLMDLNAEYGTDFKSVDELDKDTIDLWNKGVDLKKAYAANNMSKIIDARVAQAKSKQSGKDHLTEPKSGAQGEVRNLSSNELKVFKLFNPDATDEEIREFVKNNSK